MILFISSTLRKEGSFLQLWPNPQSTTSKKMAVIFFTNVSGNSFLSSSTNSVLKIAILSGSGMWLQENSSLMTGSECRSNLRTQKMRLMDSITKASLTLSVQAHLKMGRCSNSKEESEFPFLKI